MTDRRTPRHRAPPRPLDGPAKVTGTAPTPTNTSVERPAVPAPGAGDDRPRPHHRDATAEARRHRRRRRRPHRFDAPRLADTDDGDLAVLQDDQVALPRPAHRRRHRRDAETARQAAGLVRVELRRAPRHRAPRRPPRPLRAGEGQRRTSGPTPPTATSRPRCGRRRRRRRRRTPRRTSTTTRWNPMPRLRSGTPTDRRADAVRLHPGCARRAAGDRVGLRPREEQIRVVAKNVGGGFGSKGPRTRTTCSP